MGKEKSLLTKVAKGIAFGDVSNYAVRNILTEISRQVYGDFSHKDMKETMEYFDWRCPYTGRYLKDDYDNKNGNYATDHIYPQNRVWCGLNVKGNLVLVDKQANCKKRDQDVEEFLLYDTEVLGQLDETIRQERLDKIKSFQKRNDYDPEKIKNAISYLLQQWYDKIRENQEAKIKEVIDVLGAIGVCSSPEIIDKIVKSSVATKKVTEMDAFKVYLIDECGRSKTTAIAYKNSRDKIAKELGIQDAQELDQRIEEAIDYCTKEKETAKKCGDGKREKHYNDCRSALKKYKDFIETREINS